MELNKFKNQVGINEGHIKVLKYIQEEVGKLFVNVSNLIGDFAKIAKAKSDQESKLIREADACLNVADGFVDHVVPELRWMRKNDANLKERLFRKRKCNISLQKQVNLAISSADALKAKYVKVQKLSTDWQGKYNEQVAANTALNAKNDELEKKLVEMEKKQDQWKEEQKLDRIYSAASGSVMASLLWKTSKSKDTIQTYVNSGHMNSFLNMANNTLLSFFETYSTKEIPSNGSFELNYITSLLGVCINIVAQKSGREFLLQREIGEELIKNIVFNLKAIRMPQGRVLKRLTLMFLYNLTFTNEGTHLMQTDYNTAENITKCFEDNNSNDIKKIAIFLLEVLLNDPPKKFKSALKEKFSKDEANTKNFKKFLEGAPDEKTFNICIKVLKKLDLYDEKIFFDKK